MKDFSDVRGARKEPDPVTETQLMEGYIRKGAALGLFSKSSGHRKDAQKHFREVSGVVRNNAGDPLELQVAGLNRAVKEIADGSIATITSGRWTLGSISLIAVLVPQRKTRSAGNLPSRTRCLVCNERYAYNHTYIIYRVCSIVRDRLFAVKY